jgi:tetratricopeptide (TPR) repeat protein
MYLFRTIFFLTSAAFYLYIATTLASEFDLELLEIQHQWANANYQLTGDTKEKTFISLLDRCAKFEASNPNKAEALIWNGIVNSSYAGIKGGIGALKYAKKAKKLFEDALKIDPKALNGSAHTSLGTLYYKVPGFPVGFGNKKKAQSHLLKALEINPNGIDANYFYGDYLISKKKYKEAIPVLEKALNAEARPNRSLADKGRKEEIKAALSLAHSKI